MKSQTHLVKEENLTVTIETLTLEVSRLKSKLEVKENQFFERIGSCTPPVHEPHRIKKTRIMNSYVEYNNVCRESLGFRILGLFINKLC